MTKIKPLGKRVLVKRSEAVQTKGGIFLPDTAQEKPREGEVVAYLKLQCRFFTVDNKRTPVGLYCNDSGFIDPLGTG